MIRIMIMKLDKLTEVSKYIKQDRKRELKKWKKALPDDLEKRFGKNSSGFWELMDRVNLVAETWDDYVLTHPSTVLDKNLFEICHKISSAMHETYQIVGNYVCNASEIQEKETLERFSRWAKNDIENIDEIIYMYECSKKEQRNSKKE